MIVPPGVDHATSLEAPAVRASSVHVARERVAEIADALGVRENSVLPLALGEGGEAAATLGRLLVGELTRRDDGHLLVVESLTDSLVVHALRAVRERRQHSGARDTRILAALDRLDSCYAEPLTVVDLASNVGMSRFHFSRLFQEQVGLSPYRYLQRVRIHRAAELLSGGHHNVTEAALAVGFRDFGRFARVFRREMGRRPSEALRAGRSSVPAAS
jgi:AraC family transcriptional regulator